MIRAWLITLVATVAGCTVWNRVDVCKPGDAGLVTVNRRFDGSQTLGSPWAVAGLPTGNAMVVFVSEVPGRDPTQATEVRTARLGPGGAALPSCERNDLLDDIVIPVDLTDPMMQLRRSPALAPPPATNRSGLIAYVAQERGRPPELWGIFFDATGCPAVPGSDRRKPFLIGSVKTGEDLVGQVVLSLGADGPDNDFLVVWEELKEARLVARARIVRETPSNAVFPPTSRAANGAAVDLPDVPALLFGLAPVRIPPDRLAIAAYSGSDHDPGSIELWMFDDRLTMLGPAIPVASGLAPGSFLPGRYIVSAFDGQSLLIVYEQGDSAGRPRMHALVLDSMGQARAAPRPLSTAAQASESGPTVMAWPDYGFLVAWRQQDSGPGDASGPRLLAQALDPSGAPRFTGRACGEGPFTIAEGKEGDRRQPSLGLLPSHDVLAVWTDESKQGTDTSGSAVAGRFLELSSLFVGTSHPGGAVTPPRLGAAPPPTGPAGRTSSTLCAPVPGLIALDGPCLCDSDCERGDRCVLESAAGFPGGTCARACNPAQPDCGGGANVCVPDGTGSGSCYHGCASDVDCPPARICSPSGICLPHCTSDGECRSRHCDPYLSLCTDGTPRAGGGVYDPCLRDEDCRSRICTRGRCQTGCLGSRPHCPEDAVCVPFDRPDGPGTCQPPCPGGTCADRALTCVSAAVGAHCR
jgi:hypothetical protein